ncbi:MAG: hypothetical protein ACOYL6_18235 [Bacteriovoracaceae bacterium]
MAHSYAGDIFKVMQEEFGDCTDFIIYYQKDVHSEKETYRYSHAEQDGISGFIDVLKKKNWLNDNILPTLPVTPKPPGWYILWRFCVKSLELKVTSSSYKNYDSKRENHAHEIPPSQYSMTLSLEESHLVDRYARENKIPIMSLLLFTLDETVKKLTTEEGKRIWMVPVTLRKKADQEVKAGEDPLLTGFMDIKLPQKDARTLALHIKAELMKAAHWVGFYSFGLSRFTGITLLRYLIRLQAKLQNRAGNFSYLGRWNEEGKKDLSNQTDLFGGYPPVVHNQPVAGITLHWRGRLILNFMMHPFLSRDPADAQKIVHNWKENLLSKARSHD